MPFPPFFLFFFFLTPASKKTKELRKQRLEEHLGHSFPEIHTCRCKGNLCGSFSQFPGCVAAPEWAGLALHGSFLVLSFHVALLEGEEIQCSLNTLLAALGRGSRVGIFCFVLAFFQLWSSIETMKGTLPFQLPLRNNIRMCPSILFEKRLSSRNFLIRIRGEAESKWSVLSSKKKCIPFLNLPTPWAKSFMHIWHVFHLDSNTAFLPTLSYSSAQSFFLKFIFKLPLFLITFIF